MTSLVLLAAYSAFLISNLAVQPPRSAIKGPLGTFKWRFLQARYREEYIRPQYFLCMANRIFTSRLTVSCWLGMKGHTGEGKAWTFKRLLLRYYVNGKWSVESIDLHSYYCDPNWWYPIQTAETCCIR
jgi:hypothetical protein